MAWGLPREKTVFLRVLWSGQRVQLATSAASSDKGNVGLRIANRDNVVIIIKTQHIVKRHFEQALKQISAASKLFHFLKNLLP
ncbi:MAG: hypothetical protein BGO90_09370 [Legionella sp. 40-6]|nr:MAG: hypothetical protein BGO90_09370 [Legionella sp. 40-6]